MVLPWEPLHNPLVQLALSIPVYAMGLWFFGKSAYHSLKSGVPNMDVLIFMGAASAFFYSVFGTLYYWNTHEVHMYLFYETGATIISLVLMGNLLEKRSVKKTTTAITSLSALQVKTATLLLEHDGHVHTKEVEVSQLKKGDTLQINTGDSIPIDSKVVFGEAECDESLLSGESLPVHKVIGSTVIGGTLVLTGNMKVEVTTNLKDTVLSQIIELVKKAQGTKPSIQKLGDQVSAIFVPVVVGISVLTFLISYFFLDLGSAQSMLRAVAVLVISCPCAMGLATPTAIMVGIGKAAKRGILIKGGDVLENFAKSKKIIFDKTGTLTTGMFSFSTFWFKEGEEQNSKAIIYALESHSSHPIAKALAKEFKTFENPALSFSKFDEVKGLGIKAIDSNGDEWALGSGKFMGLSEAKYDLYLNKNKEQYAAWNITDELKPDAKQLISYLKEQGVENVLLSGDATKKVKQMSEELGIEHYFAEQMPAQKLAYIEQEQKLNPLVMVGDGVNDAPALSKVSVGISFAKGSDIAIKSANLVLMHNDMKALQEAHIISKQTYKTIKQNLFWAFFYNVICIPLAAAGFMHPMLGALSMAFSDVIVIGNSLLLGLKKVKAD
ncbi:MAG: ATPase P [Bacteroidetes bacterium B1(2017)]|nr:MAG: ATPase P [Bacteroidetes bacterium B1(2017)]